MPRVLATFTAVIAVVVGVLVPATFASASTSSVGGVSSRDVKMSLDGFDPGNIISDAVFTDKNTMSETQIQSFFNSKVSRCLGGTDEKGRPIVCLKDFSITSSSRPADTYCNGYSGAANESAARIIYRVAQSCGINPQVLIVMLQKEQGLVTHTWPSAWRYDIALGQGCPDDAACDPAYVGFFYQIYGAARQMKIYLEGRYFTYYAPGKTWNILYNPNRNCGSSPVYVANKATSALYYYTPYQPNAAALRAGYGEGDACSAYGNRNFYNYFTDWFGSAQGVSKDDPFGALEVFEARPGKIVAAGWAIDPNSAESIDVHVYVGATGSAYKANLERADVGKVYPDYGTKHGFLAEVVPPASGEYEVCVYAINVGAGGNRTLACKRLGVLTGDPIGGSELISASGSAAAIEVAGWALDPDTADPIDVHVYVDGVGQAIKADRSRSDIASAYPLYGARHGYSLAVPASSGEHTVCVYAINAGPGANKTLGCQKVTVRGQSIEEQGRAPIGAFEALTSKDGTVTAAGWALDPDTAASIKVHFYVGDVGRAFDANKTRTDVAAAYPGYGSAHGFDATFSVAADTARVCAYAINTGAGENTLLGCRDVVVADMPEKARAPLGALESVQVTGDTARIGGWALDPDTRKPVKIHVYVGTIGTAYVADKTRTDVGNAYPGYGDVHGFDESIALPVGKSTLCVYAIDTKNAPNSLLGCRDVTVAPPIPELGRAPIGALETVRVQGSSVTFAGWALDPDTSASVRVHLYVGASGTEYVADRQRADVAAAYPGYGAAHGFDIQATVPPGKNTVCAYAINTGPGANSLLGCRDVTVSAPATEQGRDPIGNFEALVGEQGAAVVAGWTLDPDTADPIAVHVYVDGVGQAFVADLERADVAAAFPGSGSRHGFSQRIALAPGTHQVCAYGINNGPGSNSLLACRSVVVR